MENTDSCLFEKFHIYDWTKAKIVLFMALPHSYCGRPSCFNFQMHVSGHKEITWNFAVTDNHGSTIENTVFIDVDKLLLNHRHKDFYCDSAHENYSHPSGIMKKTVEEEHYFSMIWSASIEPCLTMLVDLPDQNKGKYFIVYEIILEAFLKI